MISISPVERFVFLIWEFVYGFILRISSPRSAAAFSAAVMSASVASAAAAAFLTTASPILAVIAVWTTFSLPACPFALLISCISFFLSSLFMVAIAYLKSVREMVVSLSVPLSSIALLLPEWDRTRSHCWPIAALNPLMLSLAGLKSGSFDPTIILRSPTVGVCELVHTANFFLPRPPNPIREHRPVVDGDQNQGITARRSAVG